MKRLSHLVLLCVLMLVVVALPGAQAPAEKVDLAMIAKIRDEGLKRSQVMDHISWLSDVYGPRLTGGPGIRQAADWTLKKFAEWGLANGHLETFPFGKGWSLVRFSAHLVEPQVEPLIGFPGSWSSGTRARSSPTSSAWRRHRRSRAREVSRHAEGQDRPDAAGARGAHARRPVHPQDDGQGSRRSANRFLKDGRRRRARRPWRGRRRAALPSASSRSSRSSTKPRASSRSSIAAATRTRQRAAASSRGCSSGPTAERSSRPAAARAEPTPARAADGHARGRALQPSRARARQGRAGEGRAERRDEVLRRDDRQRLQRHRGDCPAAIPR